MSLYLYAPDNNESPQLTSDGQIVVPTPFTLHHVKQKPYIVIPMINNGENVANDVIIPIFRVFAGNNNGLKITIVAARAPFTFVLRFLNASGVFRSLSFVSKCPRAEIQLLISDFVLSYELEFKAAPFGVNRFDYILSDQVNSTLLKVE
mgnify:CR=1 FL=1